MVAMTKARLDVVALGKHIGAEIRGLDLHDKPDDETIKAIYQAWLDQQGAGIQAAQSFVQKTNGEPGG